MPLILLNWCDDVACGVVVVAVCELADERAAASFWVTVAFE